MGVYIWGPNETHNLPSSYQEVEYIQLTGTQYISSFRFPVNFRFTIKAAFDATTTYYNIYDTQSVSPMLWVDASGRLEMNINYKSSEFIKNTFITVVSDATGTDNIVTINGTQVISGTKVSTITQDTFLLHRGASDGFKGKIAYMLLEDGNTKVFELIPCYRKSDDVIGLYDLVNDTFYTNTGTGTFTKGADINAMKEKELKNAYIGEYKGWTRPSNLKGGYWKLDGNMNDSSGNGHTGSGTSHYTTDRSGTANGAYDASSSSYYVSIPNSSELYMTNGESFSFGFWIKPYYGIGTGSTYGVISMTQNIDYYPGWSIHNDSTSRNWQIRIHANGQSTVGGPLSDLNFNANERFHFVITYDGTTLKYYKNATLLGSFTYTVGDCSTSYPLTIGYASTWSASGYAAYDDTFYMKNYCLSKAEIEEIYEKGIYNQIYFLS